VVFRWFLDGNFKMAPPVFRQGQLYVLRAPLDSTYVTCVYALMAGKSQAEYEELLRAVVNTCHQYGFSPDPSVVITDFEVAVMRATLTFWAATLRTLAAFTISLRVLGERCVCKSLILTVLYMYRQKLLLSIAMLTGRLM